MPKILPIEDKLLQNMPAATLAGRLMALPAPKRLATLLERNDAEAVVAALSEPDFYLFVKELDPGSAAPLLAMARPEQLTHLIDIDGWQGDELLAGKTIAWCEAMLTANEARFLDWLYRVDFEFLVVLFQKWLDRVVIAGEEDRDFQEENDALPQLTVDNQYYFSTLYPAHEPLLKYILGYLFETHHGFYRSLLHSVQAGMETEVNELAYRFHRGRLADHAIPDAEEAATVYRPLKATQLPRDKVVMPTDSEDPARPPTFALAMVHGDDLLSTALARIDDAATRATLQQEMAALANKMVVIDKLEPDEPTSLLRGAAKAAATVNLGLDLLCAGDAALATEALTGIYLENLFRLGHTRLATLRNRLTDILEHDWLSRWPNGLNLLDEPWLEIVDLLAAKTPMCLRPQPRGLPTAEDYLRTGADLARAEECAAVIEALAPLFSDCERCLAGDWSGLAARLHAKAQIHDLAEITLGSMILTGAANFIWHGNWEITPLPVAHWGEVAPRLAPSTLEAAIAQRLRELTPEKSGRDLAQRYLQPLFDRYREEMEGRDQLPDPRLVHCFLFGDPPPQ